MIIELFGIPGSGKSYCCEKIEKKENIKDVTKFFKEKIIGKAVFHFFLKFFKINKELNEKYNEMINVLGDTSNYNNILDKKINICLYLKYLLFIYFLEKKCKMNIIVDEGIIHYSIVLFAEFSVDFDKIEKIIEVLKIYSKEKMIIGIKCNKEIAIKRMEIRNRKRTSLDFLEYGELSKLLDRYIIAEQFFSYKFKMLNIEEVENLIIQKVKEKTSDKV